MTHTENLHRLMLRWVTRDARAIEKIRQRFNIPHYTTINGKSPVEVNDEDLAVLEETERRGFVVLLKNEKWCKNGEVFVFNSRK